MERQHENGGEWKIHVDCALIIEVLEMELHKMGARNIEDRANSNNARKGNKSKYAQQLAGMFFWGFLNLPHLPVDH